MPTRDPAGRLSLPIDAELPNIVAALEQTGAVVVEAPPGAGKTTRVPQALLEANAARDGAIVVLEPRRLAARLAAQRVAQELGCKLGDTVGVSSAGLHPQPASDAQMAIETLMTYFEIDASSHIPRSVTDIQLDDFDYVVAVDKQVAKGLSALPPERLIVWNIPDPWGDDVLEYRNSALRINHEVSKLAAVLKKREP